MAVNNVFLFRLRGLCCFLWRNLWLAEISWWGSLEMNFSAPPRPAMTCHWWYYKLRSLATLMGKSHSVATRDRASVVHQTPAPSSAIVSQSNFPAIYVLQSTWGRKEMQGYAVFVLMKSMEDSVMYDNYALYFLGWNYWSIPKLQRYCRWSLWMDK